MKRISRTDRALWDDFRRVIRLIRRRLAAVLASCAGLGLSDYEALALLARTPRGRRRLNDLTEQVGLSRTATTMLTDRLEVAGFVTRERDPVDGRGVVAVLTPAGRGWVRQAGPVYAATIAECFTGPLRARGRAAVGGASDRILASRRPQ